MTPTQLGILALFFVAMVAIGVRRSRQSAGAKDMIAAGAVVIDVRSAAEVQSGHLPGALLMPHDTIAARLSDIEKAAGGKDRPIVVYCASGMRSAKAQSVLAAAGFTKVVNGGGYAALMPR